MSRRIGEDFASFSSFLQRYSLVLHCSDQQIDIYKAMHKKLFGFLVFAAEFEAQKVHEDSNPFFAEMSSDLLLSLFCAVQGMYKPAKLELRCSMELLLKAIVMTNNSNIIEEKSVYTVFDIAKQDKHFLAPFAKARINTIENDYSTLCRTVHGDPNVMSPVSALMLLPQYEEHMLRDLSKLYVRTVENYLALFYFNYPDVVDNMHPENKKDFLDCMAKSDKCEVIVSLFG